VPLSPGRTDAAHTGWLRSLPRVARDGALPSPPETDNRGRSLGRILRDWAAQPFAWRKLSLLETVVVALILVAIMVAQLGFGHASYLLQRNFWLDEIYTLTLVSDPDWTHSLRALAGGVETHPPMLYVVLRLFTGLLGECDEVALRSFALLSVFLSLLGIFVMLRRAYAPAVAFTAVLALWGHGLVVHHAFEARFYGPWLAAIVWFAYLLARARTAERARWLTTALALCSILVCTIHYFGIISLVLVTGFDLLFQRTPQRLRWSTLLAVAAGPVCLTAWIPVLLEQRSAFTVPTWVAPPTLSTITQIGTWLLLPASLSAVLLAAWLSKLFRSVVPPRGDAAGPPEGAAFLSGLTGLLLLPVVLLVISFTILPVFVDRYAFPAVAALAPAVAFVAARMSRPWVLIVGLYFALVSTHQLSSQAEEARERDRRTERLIATIRSHRGDKPVVCEQHLVQYVLHHYAPDLAPSCFMIDHEPGQTNYDAPDYFFARDLCRRYEEFYRAPKLLKWDALCARRQSCLLVVGVPWTSARKAAMVRAYPGFIARPIDPGLYELAAE
jgi:hypothetical protein